MRTVSKGFLFSLFTLALILPSLQIPVASAQTETGIKWKVTVTFVHQGTDSDPYFFQEITAILEPDPNMPGANILSGNGTGTWQWRDPATEECPAYSGSGAFPAAMTAIVGQVPSEQVRELSIGAQAMPGRSIAESEDFEKRYTVTCHSPPDYVFDEERSSAPVPLLPQVVLKNTTSGWYGEEIGFQTDCCVSKFTVTLSPPDIEYRIYGTVKDSVGNSLFESKLVLADFRDLTKSGLLLNKLSTSRPNYIDSTTASDSSDAKYEFVLEETPDMLLAKFLVVSVLWYDSKPEFAVTNGDEIGGRYIPVYQALCVDNIPEGDCVDWEQAENGYEAEVDFVYGKKASHTDAFMEREDWQKGSGSLDRMMEGAGFTYYNTYLGVKHIDKLGLGFPANPFMVKNYHTQDTCATNPKSAYYLAARGTAPHFGGLGSSLEIVQARGGDIYICYGDSTAHGPDAPFNREWHELGHYLLFNLYAPRDGTNYNNHAGYANDSTNDSYIEGFAEFFSMLTSEHYGEPRPYLYPIGGTWYNLEQDYKVWGGHNHEEFATAGILWDLHDSGVEANQGFMSDDGYVGTVSRVYNQTTDKVSLQGSEIVKALQTSRVKTLVGIYVASMSSVSSENLDMIFLNHGAFADISERNYIHDAWNETISQTGNTANRMVRFSPVPELPGSYIKSDANALVEVVFNHVEPFRQHDYSYTMNLTANEPVYFSMPPQYYPSKAVFSQLSGDGTVLTSNITTIDSGDYWSYIDSGPSENATFKTIQVSNIVPVSSGNTTPPPESGNQSPAQPSGGGCLIATAAFGSELTPQVQLLRNFRDNHILSTVSGSSFMNVFNAWYYSFSPQVADYEREQPWLQQMVRVGIYPLLGILQAAEKAYAIVPGEFGSVSAGLVASSLIGGVYFSPIALSIKRVRKGKFRLVLFAAIMSSVSIAVAISLQIGSPEAMMASTASFVVATVAISAVLVAKALYRIIAKVRARVP